MTFTAAFRYQIKSGRSDDFMAKLAKAGSPEFNSEAMPTAIRLMQRIGIQGEQFLLEIDYQNEADYQARTAYEHGNAD